MNEDQTIQPDSTTPADNTQVTNDVPAPATDVPAAPAPEAPAADTSVDVAAPAPSEGLEATAAPDGSEAVLDQAGLDALAEEAKGNTDSAVEPAAMPEAPAADLGNEAPVDPATPPEAPVA